jgi:crotonobetainyl-CoA:carnitine CoA-transferase CaiB-like acyl-CoA transferase
MAMLDGSVDQSSLPIADVLGAHAIVESVLIGLFTRQLKEPSLDFDVSIFDTLISTLSIYLEPLWNRDGSGGFPAEPGYGTFTTADQQVIALGVAHEDKFWQALCAVLGLLEEQQLTRGERFAHHGELRRRIANAIACFEAPVLEERLLAYDVPFGWARNLGEIANHPQVIARELTGNIQSSQRTYVRQPLTIDGERPTKGHRLAPGLGEDTTKILTERRSSEEDTESGQLDRRRRRVGDLPGQKNLAPNMQSQQGGAND